MLMRERELETTSSQTGIAVRLLIVLGIVLALILAALRHNGTWVIAFVRRAARLIVSISSGSRWRKWLSSSCRMRPTTAWLPRSLAAPGGFFF
jgi:uncharacterized membrane protein